MCLMHCKFKQNQQQKAFQLYFNKQTRVHRHSTHQLMEENSLHAACKRTGIEKEVERMVLKHTTEE